jgi:hypothetical protein
VGGFTVGASENRRIEPELKNFGGIAMFSLSPTQYTQLQNKICETHGIPVRGSNWFYQLVYNGNTFGVIRTPYSGYYSIPQEVKLEDGGFVFPEYDHEVDEEGTTYLIMFESEWDKFMPVKVDYKLED